MKQPLKNSITHHLNNKALSNQQLKQLQALQVKPSKKTYSSYFKLATMASALLLSFILSFYYIQSVGFSTLSIEQRIAEEVAKNHLKLKPLEIKSNTLQGLSSYFKQLNFSPVNPNSISLSKQNLLGGRYCSIQGVTALQLRMINKKTNKVQTLYETEYDKLVFKHFPEMSKSGEPVTVYVKGMKIDMWVEKDILFALVE